MKEKGTKYVWGGGSCKGPTKGGYDCSGLVAYAVCKATKRNLFKEGLRVTYSMYCASSSRLGKFKYAKPHLRLSHSLPVEISRMLIPFFFPFPGKYPSRNVVLVTRSFSELAAAARIKISHTWDWWCKCQLLTISPSATACPRVCLSYLTF